LSCSGRSARTGPSKSIQTCPALNRSILLREKTGRQPRKAKRYLRKRPGSVRRPSERLPSRLSANGSGNKRRERRKKLRRPGFAHAGRRQSCKRKPHSQGREEHEDIVSEIETEREALDRRAASEEDRDKEGAASGGARQSKKLNAPGLSPHATSTKRRPNGPHAFNPLSVATPQGGTRRRAALRSFLRARSRDTGRRRKKATLKEPSMPD
jgi:hypothetical protein